MSPVANQVLPLSSPSRPLTWRVQFYCGLNETMVFAVLVCVSVVALRIWL